MTNQGKERVLDPVRSDDWFGYHWGIAGIVFDAIEDQPDCQIRHLARS